MDPVVSVAELRKHYGAVAAVDGVSFEVGRGEAFGIVGSNGAGKTTTVECLEGLRRPDGGSLRVLGLDPARHPRALHRRIGVQLQRALLPNRLKVWEALDLYSALYGRRGAWRPPGRARHPGGAGRGPGRGTPRGRRPRADHEGLIMPRALDKLVVTELKLYLREPVAVLFTVGFPLLLLWLNSGNGNKPSPRFGGIGPLDVIVPGYLAMILATTGLTSLPGLLASYRERGILRRLAVTPVPPVTLLVAELAAHLAVGTLGACVLVGTGMAWFGLRSPAAPGALLAAYLLGALALFSIGFVLAALLPAARTAEAVGLMVFFPMIFLSGAVVPREDLAGPVRRIGDYLPLTLVVKALRSAWAGAGPGVLTLSALVAIIVVGTALAARLFRWE